MRNKTYTLFFLIFIATICTGQSHIDLRPTIKSPEVAKFEQYMNMPVNLTSGTPQVNIPVYTLEYGGMSLPISLEYDAGGVKVESIGSSVGQNWSLNVGGVVSRIIKGIPDEGSYFTPTPRTTDKINTDGYYQDYGLSNLNTGLTNLASPTFVDSNTQSAKYTMFSYWLSDLLQGYKDAQPDLFYFSTPEGGSKFVFNDKREVVYLENTDFIIKETFEANQFKSWLATSPNGIKYSFGQNGLNEQSLVSQVGETLYTLKTNSWFLNQIENYATNKKISIEYVDSRYSNIQNVPPSKMNTPCVSGYPALQPECSSERYYSFSEDPFNDAFKPDYFKSIGDGRIENQVKSKLISKIVAGTTEIRFNYSNRNDLADISNNFYEFSAKPKRLSNIEIIENGQCVKKFSFYCSEIEAEGLTSSITDSKVRPLYKRLMLNGFSEISCDGSVTKGYAFVYNKTKLPPKNSFAMDKWGFYNGVNSNRTLIPRYVSNQQIYADRSVNFEYAKAGSLEQIVYPTGGVVDFEYESHRSSADVVDDTYNPSASQARLVGGLRIKSISHKTSSSIFVNNLAKKINYSYSVSKITSNPKRVYRIDYDIANCYDDLANYTSILSLTNTSYLKKFMTDFTSYYQRNIGNGINYRHGYTYFVSTGVDLLDVNFIGPHITYGSVTATEIDTNGLNNGRTTTIFNNYKNYFELTGNYANQEVKQIPAPPQIQSILAGEKANLIYYNKAGNRAKSNDYYHNISTQNTVVVGLNVLNIGGAYVFYPYTLKGQTKTLKSETETISLNGQDVVTTKQYEYGNASHNQPTKITTTDNQGNQTLETRMAYPLDLQNEPNASSLIAQNRKSTPLKVETFRGTEKLSEQITKYSTYPTATTGVVLTLPQFVWTKKGESANPLEKKVTYNYDPVGNLIEYTPESGVATVIVWGYNKTLPIAKIENATYAQVEALLGTGFVIAEGFTTAQESTLRSGLSNAMVTTYTHRPLVGVTSITDPKGDKITYSYDSFNRLQFVKDKDGNLLSENQYNYKKP